jgi:hypothetical protein
LLLVVVFASPGEPLFHVYEVYFGVWPVGP